MIWIPIGEIYGHLSVISLPLENLEFYTIDFPKTQVVKCCVKVFWFIEEKVSKLAEN